ncbi:MAG TPA: bifunctional methionine sulfoxide reductase B/A protein [bacterium]|nr:bifunctional methionine sulfoxide reductase B/A protein [bacterium]
MEKAHSLSPATLAIVKHKGTEYPFTGEYTDQDQAGTYLCRQCGLALFRAETKFHSGCGWPSFDREISGQVKRLADADGQRIEILCERCGAHLGHVFTGEGFTPQSTRHCVNSLSLDFVADSHVLDSEEAILAAGCFWGVEHFLQTLPGVLKTEVGYTGGQRENPSYEQVCSQATGHVEAIRVLFDPQRLSYEALLRYFFEIHDPTQANGQGPDLGPQYLSQIFYFDKAQKKQAEQVMSLLGDKGLVLATTLKPVSVFWPAEKYHQAYYVKNQQGPYCHFYTKRFGESHE